MIGRGLQPHQAAMLFLNGGLGNGLILAPALRRLEHAMPALTYYSAPNEMLVAPWVREPLGLRGPVAALPPLWRRFHPVDHEAILDFAGSAGATLVVNLRKEAAAQDGNYFRFRPQAQERGIECWDLHELDQTEQLLPIGLQALRVLERHGATSGATVPTWLSALYQPRADVVGLCVGASVAVKRWPVARWSSVIAFLRSEGRTVEVMAGPADAERAVLLDLAAKHGDEIQPVQLSTVDALRDWIAGLAALVTNDTLSAHLAAALGCPTTVLYLATDGRIWAPWADPIRFEGVQSEFALRCDLMKPDGTCFRYYGDCPAPCHEGVSARSGIHADQRVLAPRQGNGHIRWVHPGQQPDLVGHRLDRG